METIKDKILDLKNTVDKLGTMYSADILKGMYFDLTKMPELLLNVYDKIIEHKRKQEKENETVRTYITRKNNMSEYLKHLKNGSMAINDVNMSFVEEYKDYRKAQIAYFK